MNKNIKARIKVAEREGNLEVGVDSLGMGQPLVKLRLKLTKAEAELERLRAENEMLTKELEQMETYSRHLEEMTDE